MYSFFDRFGTSCIVINHIPKVLEVTAWKFFGLIQGPLCSKIRLWRDQIFCFVVISCETSFFWCSFQFFENLYNSEFRSRFDRYVIEIGTYLSWLVEYGDPSILLMTKCRTLMNSIEVNPFTCLTPLLTWNR